MDKMQQKVVHLNNSSQHTYTIPILAIFHKKYFHTIQMEYDLKFSAWLANLVAMRIVYHFHLLYSCSPPYSFRPSCSRFCLCWNILLSIITTASIIILSEFFIIFQAHIYHQEITFNFMFYNLAIGSERKQKTYLKCCAQIVMHSIKGEERMEIYLCICLFT